MLKIGNVSVDIVNYVLPSYKLDFGTNKRDVLITDLHGYHNDPERRNAILWAIRQLDPPPHHIVIAGDIMRGTLWRKRGEEVENFRRFVKELSKIAPVFISQGNHDIQGKGEQLVENDNVFMEVANVNPGAVFPLINDSQIYDGFKVIGFTPTPSLVDDLSIQMHGVAHDRFIKEVDEKIKEKPAASDDMILEYAGHSPYLIGVSENGIGLGCFVTIDTFLTGHLHNGYIENDVIRQDPDKYLDRKGYTERPIDRDRNGRIIPWSIRPFFGGTNLCRGTIWLDDRAQQCIQQLRNGHFYLNADTRDNKQKWALADPDEARKMILDYKEHAHAMVISGGIHKYTGIQHPEREQLEITVVDYEGAKTR